MNVNYFSKKRVKNTGERRSINVVVDILNICVDIMSGNPELLIGDVITTLCTKMSVTGADTPNSGLSVKFLEKC